MAYGRVVTCFNNFTLTTMKYVTNINNFVYIYGNVTEYGFNINFNNKWS